MLTNQEFYFKIDIVQSELVATRTFLFIPDLIQKI